MARTYHAGAAGGGDGRRGAGLGEWCARPAARLRSVMVVMEEVMVVMMMVCLGESRGGNDHQQQSSEENLLHDVNVALHELREKSSGCGDCLGWNQVGNGCGNVPGSLSGRGFRRK